MDLYRRELKFQISQHQMDGICEYLPAHCDMDKHSILSDDGHYTINSLYLDTENMLLLENKRKNLPSRFSIRIRSYGDPATEYPVFLEIKKKVNGMVAKQRITVRNPQTWEFLRDGVQGENNPDLQQAFLPPIAYHIWRLGLSPRIMTQYRRKAYFGRNEPYTRVTFDRNLRCYPEYDYCPFPNEEKFAHYDNMDVYKSPS
ncbi:MAG: polyphosphate polymerase domain-containing protein, partial [Bdellovibrionales bacterium]|nr:polyphosphate polymerase domain-containing protein [Bdellovibrionales bacterium]